MPSIISRLQIRTKLTLLLLVFGLLPLAGVMPIAVSVPIHQNTPHLNQGSGRKYHHGIA
jgi:hypothetical protein